MGRKKILIASRRLLRENGEKVIIGELAKLRAPLWRQILGFFNVEFVRSWYKSQERIIEQRVAAGCKTIYRRAKK